MPLLRIFLIAAVCCILVLPGRTQPPTWKSMRFGKISLSYPPTWRVTKVTQDNQPQMTLTPDSMKNLSMKIIEAIDLPVVGDHTYANFKSNFTSILTAQPGAEIKVLKSEEITLKGHKTMYAEVLHNSLPAKVYAINGGADIYLFFILPRRYSTVADPAMERDEKTILNSIRFFP